METLLPQIVELSHFFGSSAYVKGGGGNTSVKDPDGILWMKPSGRALNELSAADFIPMRRTELDRLAAADLSADPQKRETAVKEILAAAVLPGAQGRPSVETSLHNAFSARYVVHTHPELVNGMTCANDGEKVCSELFPDSVWIPYTDPGYVLFKEVVAAIADYKQKRNCEPSLIFLENHGVFAAAASPEEIRALYRQMLDTLVCYYARHGLAAAEPPTVASPLPAAAAAKREMLSSLLDGAAVAAAPVFPVADGPLTPDHIVYSKSYPFRGEITADAIAAFKKQHGYIPVVFVQEEAVYAAAATMKRAELALTLARDGAEVMRYAGACGGVHYMSSAARQFIENWEVEAYRSAQIK